MAQPGSGPVATGAGVTDALAVYAELADGHLQVVFVARPSVARRGPAPCQARWSAHARIDHRGVAASLRRLLADPPAAWLALLAGEPYWGQRCPAIVAELAEGLQTEIDRQVQAVLREQPPWG